MRRFVEGVERLLPIAVAFDTDFYAAEDDLFATFEIDA
jgi:hypothetical protein